MRKCERQYYNKACKNVRGILKKAKVGFLACFPGGERKVRKKSGEAGRRKWLRGKTKGRKNSDGNFLRLCPGVKKLRPDKFFA